MTLNNKDNGHRFFDHQDNPVDIRTLPQGTSVKNECGSAFYIAGANSKPAIKTTCGLGTNCAHHDADDFGPRYT